MRNSSDLMGFSSPRRRPFRSAGSVLFGLRQPSRGAFGAAVMASVVVASLLVAVSPARADGITWTSRNAAADNFWRSVAYGDGLWVAVAYSGTGNRVMTSPDGIDWTIRTSAADNSWLSVAYGRDGSGNPLWVAVANSGTRNRVMTSPDGIDWTIRTSAADRNWTSVAYGNNLWVAVATASDTAGSRVMTSPDGINWTSRNAAVDNNWNSVAYGRDGSGNPRWVAVADTGGNPVMTSPDGITWTSQNAAVNNWWRSVAYGRDGSGNPLWVAVAHSGTGNRVMTSPDGITWMSRTSAADVNWGSVAYGDGLWVAVATTGGNRVMTSPNGTDWTIRAAAANDWRSVAYGNGLWVAVADVLAVGSVNQVMTSGATNVAASPVALPPSVSCAPLPAVVRATITCTVTGGDAGIDILWRAAYNPVIAETGVTLDASGSGVFSFTVPAGALGEELTVELVDWTAPMSLGVVGGPVPTSVPSGEGPVPVWTLGLLALAGGLALRRGSRSGRSAWRVG